MADLPFKIVADDSEIPRIAFPNGTSRPASLELLQLHAAYDSLRSQVEAEVESLRKEAASCQEAGEFMEQGADISEGKRRQADKAFLQAAELDAFANRLQAILDSAGAGAKP